MNNQRIGMKRLVLCASVLLAAVVAHAAYSIPEDQLDEQKIYWGSASSFDQPAAVNIEEIIKATPEYAEIKKNKIRRGTGKYWILISEAQERAIEAITEVAEETDYDLVVEDGYLDGLKPAIPSVDITESVLEKLEE